MTKQHRRHLSVTSASSRTPVSAWCPMDERFSADSVRCNSCAMRGVHSSRHIPAASGIPSSVLAGLWECYLSRTACIASAAATVCHECQHSFHVQSKDAQALYTTVEALSPAVSSEGRCSNITMSVWRRSSLCRILWRGWRPVLQLPGVSIPQFLLRWTHLPMAEDCDFSMPAS